MVSFLNTTFGVDRMNQIAKEENKYSIDHIDQTYLLCDKIM